ncbi:MAG: hypothetical protein JW751_24410, partial [Polyangiaceae bacterium]|nr:hypothetical protein [Polyangiaceae bacterium]
HAKSIPPWNTQTHPAAPPASPVQGRERIPVLFDESLNFDPSGSPPPLGILRLPSGTEVLMALAGRSSVPANLYQRPVAHTLGGASGHLYLVRDAVPVSILERTNGHWLFLRRSAAGAQRDAALFVDTNGTTRILEAPHGGSPADFAVTTTAIPRYRVRYTWQNSWTVEGTTGSVTDGVLESVTPAGFW